MTPEERFARAFRAKVTLEDTGIKEAFEEAERDIHAEWASARFRGSRERLHAELRALRRVRSKLASMAGQAPRN